MERIIERAKNGDHLALTQLIDSHKNLAFNLAMSIVKNREDAKDITQQSFLIVLEKIDSFRAESKFSTWLYKIVYNESLKWVKINSKERIKELPREAEHTYVSDNEIDKSKMILNAINSLSENEQIIVKLFYLGGRQISEIASITEFTESNIKVLLHRGRTKLRRELNLKQYYE